MDLVEVLSLIVFLGGIGCQGIVWGYNEGLLGKHFPWGRHPWIDRQFHWMKNWGLLFVILAPYVGRPDNVEVFGWLCLGAFAWIITYYTVKLGELPTESTFFLCLPFMDDIPIQTSSTFWGLLLTVLFVTGVLSTFHNIYS